MGLKHIKLEVAYFVTDEEDSKLIVDAVVDAVCEARAVAQTLMMTSEHELPPPIIKLQVDDASGFLREIDPEVWQAKRLAEAEPEEDDSNE